MPLLRPAVRDLLETVLPTDGDLDAFCGDYFPRAYKGFAGGMNRVAKVTWLLDQEELAGIVDALRRAYPGRVAKIEAILAALDPSDVDPPPPTRKPPPLPRKGRCFGRELLTGDLCNVLVREAPPPICILGPPGIGKSTLALAVIHSRQMENKYGIRRYFVRLDSAASADAAVGSILRMLNLTPRSDPVQDLCGVLGQERTLLVLDNLETPWENETEETEALLGALTALPELSLMVSMRGKNRPEGVAWYDAIHLNPLDGDSAADVFCEIAGQNYRGDPTLSRLLEPLAGVPLAIVLLAHAAEGNSLENLVSEWKQRGMAMLPRWAVALELSMASRRMTADAGRLCALTAALPDGIAQEDLDTLMPAVGYRAARVLAQVGFAFFESDRLRMLAPIREYLAENYPPTTEDLDRAMRWYADLGLAWGPAAGGRQGAAAVRRLAPELANVDAMIRRGIDAGGDVRWWIDTALALTDFARFSGRTSPLPLQCALEAARAAGETFREANCIQSLAEIALDYYRHDEAKKHFEVALSLYRELGGAIGEANCIHSLGDIALYYARHDEARECFEVALTVYRGGGDRVGEANCIQSLGIIALDQGRYDEAEKWFEEALSSYRDAGEVLGEANCTRGLGHVALGRLKHDGARDCFERALELYNQAGSVLGEANCCEALGKMALDGQLQEAQARFERALVIYRRVGSVLGQATCRQGLGDIAMKRSHHEEAREHFDEAHQLYARVPEPYSISRAQHRLARVTMDPIRR